MYTSSADIFRTRQTLRDLTKTVESHAPVLDRIATGDDERQAIAAIVANGGRIGPGDSGVYSQLLLAAAMPDDDFMGFAIATAILLLDRLQDGAGEDDLFWNWDAFHDHYRLADAPVRAALMNGFRLADASGRVTLSAGPEGADCLTTPREKVSDWLANDPSAAKALSTTLSPEDAGRLWQRTATHDLSPPAQSGFRYLYERPGSMWPPDPMSVGLIPWSLDPEMDNRRLTS